MFMMSKKAVVDEERALSFFVDGKSFSVSNADPNQSLNEWMRSNCITGPKVMCEQGGCGCCTVALVKPGEKMKAIVSCLTPLCSVDGCHIITSKGIGSSREGFHEIQKRITELDLNVDTVHLDSL